MKMAVYLSVLICEIKALFLLLVEVPIFVNRCSGSLTVEEVFEPTITQISFEI